LPLIGAFTLACAGGGLTAAGGGAFFTPARVGELTERPMRGAGAATGGPFVTRDDDTFAGLDGATGRGEVEGRCLVGTAA
jgi:hypothetical protein